VPGVGPCPADILIVGEAPGFNEDRQGEPFVGAAGKLLDTLLARIGLSRPDVYITNVLKCRPPMNRDPMPNEAEACSPYLKRQLELVQPKVVLILRPCEGVPGEDPGAAPAPRTGGGAGAEAGSGTAASVVRIPTKNPHELRGCAVSSRGPLESEPAA